MRFLRILAVGFAGIACLASGCSHAPERIGPPTVDPVAAGKQAMELYDKDHDGAISGAELDACPALKSALKRYDAGGGKVTADTIAARINKWLEFQTGAMAIRVQVRLDGKPLPDATVTFDPEPFLGGKVAKASGKSNDNGNLVPKSEASGAMGIAPGLYKIRVTKDVGGKESIPPKYNANTTLGVEVAQDSAELQPMLRLDLKSR